MSMNIQFKASNGGTADGIGTFKCIIQLPTEKAVSSLNVGVAFHNRERAVTDEKQLRIRTINNEKKEVSIELKLNFGSSCFVSIPQIEAEYIDGTREVYTFGDLAPIREEFDTQTRLPKPTDKEQDKTLLALRIIAGLIFPPFNLSSACKELVNGSYKRALMYIALLIVSCGIFLLGFANKLGL